MEEQSKAWTDAEEYDQFQEEITTDSDDETFMETLDLSEDQSSEMDATAAAKSDTETEPMTKDMEMENQEEPSDTEVA